MGRSPRRRRRRRRALGQEIASRLRAQLFRFGPNSPTDIWLSNRRKANESRLFSGRAGPPETPVCWALKRARRTPPADARLPVHGSRRGSFPSWCQHCQHEALWAWMDWSRPWVRTQGGCTERDARTRGRPRAGLAGNERKRPAQSTPACQKSRQKPAEMSTFSASPTPRGPNSQSPARAAGPLPSARAGRCGSTARHAAMATMSPAR